MRIKTIAKIQIILGIMFLLVSIAGFASLGVINNFKVKSSSNFLSSALSQLKHSNFSNESKISLSGTYLNQYDSLINRYINIFFFALSTSILLLAISLFFIIQGIINLKQIKKK